MTVKTGLPVIDELKRSRRKTIALVIRPDGSLLVRAPLRASQRQIDAVLRDKADWIARTRQTQLQKYAHTARRHYAEGETFWYLGQQYPLRLVKTTRPALKLDQAFLLAEPAAADAEGAFKTWYRRQAAAYLPERTAYFARQHGFNYSRIRITSARTRWGSCSSRGTISFTWRLMMAPLEIIDYVIIHELAHTVHPNHSQRFWGLVETLLPDYKARRTWLKKNGYWFK